jgi:hypothetical protein
LKVQGDFALAMGVVLIADQRGEHAEAQGSDHDHQPGAPVQFGQAAGQGREAVLTHATMSRRSPWPAPAVRR